MRRPIESRELLNFPANSREQKREQILNGLPDKDVRPGGIDGPHMEWRDTWSPTPERTHIVRFDSNSCGQLVNASDGCRYR